MSRMVSQYSSRLFAAGLTVLGALSFPVGVRAQAAPTSGKSAASAIDLQAKCDDFVAKRLTAVLSAKPGATPTGWSSVIARIEGDLTPERENALTTLGADLYRRLPLIHSTALRIPTRNLAKLAALPFITRLSQDATVLKNDEFTVQHSVADGAYSSYGLTGAGVTVAVVDSGIAASKDLKDGWGNSRVLASVNFAGDNGTTDKCGHGTHVAGIIAGNGARSSGWQYYRTFYGIARSTNLVNVRVLDSQGSGSVSSVISGLNWIVQNRTQYNIRVVNLSLGHVVNESYTTDPLCQAVEAVYKSGITVVCAAGNSGRKNLTQKIGAKNEGWGIAYGTIQSPANDPYVITVGASKQNPINPYNRYMDLIATYSSRGPTRYDYNLKPDIIAPGNQVISLNVVGSSLANTYGTTNMVPMNYYSNNGGNQPSSDYIYLSGTSMASPVVAGAVALMLQANPNLTPDTIKARLMVSADKMTDPTGKSDPCTYGAGYLNIPNALNIAVTATRPAISPSLQLTTDGKNVVIDPSQVLWGGGGSNNPTPTPTPGTAPSIWGTGSVTSLQVIWGGGTQTGPLTIGTQVLNTSYLTNPGDLTADSVWMDQVLWGGSQVTVDLSSVAIYGE